VVAKRYAPNGWEFSDDSESATFSFSGRRESHATFALSCDLEGRMTVETRVPHSTFKKAVAARLSAALKEQLPPGATKVQSDWKWTHPPDEEDRFVALAIQVAKVSEAVLGEDGLRKAGALT
jgi:hypothetical protein